MVTLLLLSERHLQISVFNQVLYIIKSALYKETP